MALVGMGSKFELWDAAEWDRRTAATMAIRWKIWRSRWMALRCDRRRGSGPCNGFVARAVDGLAVKPDGVYVDGTFGRGGHSRLILSKLGENGRLFAVRQGPAGDCHC